MSYQYSSSNDQIRKLQGEVDETAGLMKDNVNMVIERGEKLEVLNDRAEQLEDDAKQFKTSGQNLKKKYWWQNTKRLLCIIGICVAAVIVIIIIVVVSLKPWEWNSSSGEGEITPAITTPMSVASKN